MMNPKQRFLSACRRDEVDRPPVWMMRQAGRYLPEYRAIKEKHQTKAMMQTPEIACEITLQPVKRLGVDAAILYSDILMIPDAMGLGLDFAVGEGPMFSFAVDSQEALAHLQTQNLNTRLDFVFQTIHFCLKKLPSDYPLLGFAGAPFTVASYMVAGKAGHEVEPVKSLAYREPKIFHALMAVLTKATIDYLIEQANAGVAAVQVFDTWAGTLSLADYQKFAQPYSETIFTALKKQGIPAIHYIKAGGHLLDAMAEMSSSVMGVDWRVSLADERLNKQAIQGGFDPDWLLAPHDFIKEKVHAMLTSVPNPKKGYIVNLGHGIGQKTPVENAQFFIDEAKAFFA
jgi:uroporphyrinogen decarboxylase